MKILVTGAVGFIGFHVAKALLERGDEVVGLDNLNDYYDVNLKLARLDQLRPFDEFTFIKLELADRESIGDLFKKQSFQRIVHLGAQAGVRYSIENPTAYVDSNLVGFTNILEGCRHNQIEHLVYASTSSVYGANELMPFSERHPADHPLSFYAATKRANELMAHSYSHLYNIPATGLRFFTVYGPWGRPDMALFKFTKAILEGKPIQIFNHGKHKRDFTYIDDIVEGVVRTLDKPATTNNKWDAMNPDVGTSRVPWRVYNIGNNKPIDLMDYILCLEKELDQEATKEFLPLQSGDVLDTYADVGDLVADVDYKPATSVSEGIASFVRWYREFY